MHSGEKPPLVLVPFEVARAVSLTIEASGTNASAGIQETSELTPCAITAGLWSIGNATSDSAFSLAWNLAVDPDPTINGSITLTNLSTVSQTFVITFSLGVSPLAGPTLIGGFVGPITLIDIPSATGASDGMAMLDTPGPFYQACIDGAGVQDLLTPFSLTATTGSPLTAVRIGRSSGVSARLPRSDEPRSVKSRGEVGP